MIDIQTAPEIVVDRGQPIIVTVSFCADVNNPEPDLVDFAYTRPGEARPYTDDGYGQPRSKIVRLSRGVYRYVISTVGFPSGDGAWHCQGEWKETHPDGYDTASIFGAYRVNQAPVQLL